MIELESLAKQEIILFMYTVFIAWDHLMNLTLLTPRDDSQLSLPLFMDLVSRGFPSPAQDYVEKELNLHDYCMKHPAATYFLRAHGNSMRDGFLFNGDLLVVDSAERPLNDDIVVASIGSEFTVKRLQLEPKLALLPMNTSFSPIYPDPDELNIFGVVTHIVHRTREIMKCLD